MYTIVYIVSTLKQVGPTNQLYYIIQHLDRQQFKPHIITLSKEPPDTRIKDFEQIDVDVRCLNLTRLQGSFYAIAKLRREISGINPDIIHSFGFRSDSYSFFLKGYKKVATLRNYPREDYRDLFGPVFAPPIASLHLAILRKSNVIACSKAISDRVAAQESMCVSVIQNGINLEKFHRADVAAKRALRNKLGLPGGSFLFIAAGSLISRKNIDFILDAFKLFPPDKMDIALLIAGDGNLRDSLSNKSKSDKRIVFLGNVSNILEYYQSADGYISASLSEGLPNSVLEAMACGLPCLLSDIPQHAEICIHSESLKKQLFPLSDPVQLMRKMMELKNSDWSAIADESRRIVETYFSAESMSQQYQRFYRELINDGVVIGSL